MSASTIRFILNGEIVETDVIDPTRTVLQFLREDLRMTGTKEGCAEGDCGACTVVVVEIDRSGDGIELKTVNSCIQFLPTIDGKELITVEGLRARTATCTRAAGNGRSSWFAMRLLHARLRDVALRAVPDEREPSRQEIDDALAGNLCRCTGYRPIIAAAQSMSSTG